MPIVAPIRATDVHRRDELIARCRVVGPGSVIAEVPAPYDREMIERLAGEVAPLEVASLVGGRWSGSTSAGAPASPAERRRR